jgi:hypothetical protein
MKFIKIFIILLLIFGCSNQKKIAEFENILGYEESNTLTYLVEDFENNYLKKTYPKLKLNEAYHSFLTDLNKTGEILNPENLSKEKYEKFNNSNLKLQIYCNPDSIWIEKDKIPSLMIKWKCLTQDEKFEYQLSESSPVSYYSGSRRISLNNNNSDSIIDFAKNRTKVNPDGSYINAIKSISEESRFIKEYIEHRDTFGDTNPSTFVNRLLNLNPDFKDYFIKRTIVIELVY